MKAAAKEVITEEVTPEKVTSEKVTTKEVNTEKVTTKQVITEKVITEKVTPKQVITEKVIAEKVTPKQVIAEKVIIEKVNTEKVITEKVIAEKVTTKQVIAREVITKAETLLNKKNPVLVAVEGRCASGKTTLASVLQDLAGWSVFHMDDFFLQPWQRTELRMQTAGGNVDYERFLAEILEPLKKGETEIVYRPYQCRYQKLAKPVYIKAKQVCLMEGSYSCHPALWDFYDLRIFLTVSPQEQKRRILARNGEDGYMPFAKQWIPLEEQYFKAYQIEERCDLHFTLC